jgi:hypothetical protein
VDASVSLFPLLVAACQVLAALCSGRLLLCGPGPNDREADPCTNVLLYRDLSEEYTAVMLREKLNCYLTVLRIQTEGLVSYLLAFYLQIAQLVQGPCYGLDG